MPRREAVVLKIGRISPHLSAGDALHRVFSW
jgi:hypothetical protein